MKNSKQSIMIATLLPNEACKQAGMVFTKLSLSAQRITLSLDKKCGEVAAHGKAFVATPLPKYPHTLECGKMYHTTC